MKGGGRRGDGEGGDKEREGEIRRRRGGYKEEEGRSVILLAVSYSIL